MESGYYLRVERNGKWMALDISEMTEEEIKKAFIDREPDELVRWIAHLAKFIGRLIEEGEG